ncbi:MAG: ABC transporter permease, partial [Spirochaetia bacterium]|nr:ABC transporter permease [Spirochaetia bacterium]
FVDSGLEKGLYGGVVWRFSIDAYASLFNPAFLKVTGMTFLLAAVSTALTIAFALPVAYYMARSRYKNFLLFLVIIPFWTNFLIRIYAWIAILGNNGFLNQSLTGLGLINEPGHFLYNPFAVVTVMVYTYLPYAILPLYAAIEKFDFSLIEAGRDLGAGKFQALRKILLPNIKAGITAAVLFTFIPVLGNYAVPQLVGGKDSFMLGNIIARELTVTRNWPLASSISVILTIATTFGILLFMRLNRNTAEKLRPS